MNIADLFRQTLFMEHEPYGQGGHKILYPLHLAGENLLLAREFYRSRSVPKTLEESSSLSPPPVTIPFYGVHPADFGLPLATIGQQTAAEPALALHAFVEGETLAAFKAQHPKNFGALALQWSQETYDDFIGKIAAVTAKGITVDIHRFEQNILVHNAEDPEKARLTPIDLQMFNNFWYTKDPVKICEELVHFCSFKTFSREQGQIIEKLSLAAEKHGLGSADSFANAMKHRIGKRAISAPETMEPSHVTEIQPLPTQLQYPGGEVTLASSVEDLRALVAFSRDAQNAYFGKS